MLDEAIACLRCPVCERPLRADDEAALLCDQGHAFDIARQGYASLLGGGGSKAPGDTAAMIDARDAFLLAGHYEPIAEALAGVACDAIAGGPPGCVLDVGAGTGYYLSRVLDALPDRVGLALDVSKYAARRAARAHPRVASVVGDTWSALPVRTGAAALVLDVFAPRNAAEFARVLAPGGALLVVTPAPTHLRELVDVLGMLHVPEDKPRRLQESLAPLFAQEAASEIAWTMELHAEDVARLVAMGPSAWHVHADGTRERIARLGDPVRVTASVVVSTYRQTA